MITSVFLNMMCLLFPFCCYFIYLIYSKAIYEKEKLIFLDLALFSSFYLCNRFGVLNSDLCFLINVPLLISICKKRLFPTILLSIGCAFVSSNIYEVNVLIILMEYLIIIMLCYLSKYKTFNIFLVVKLIYTIFIMIILPSKIICFHNMGRMVIIGIVMYLTFYLVILFYEKIDTIVKMYSSLREITKEKQLYESLFKITHEIKNPLAVCKGYLEMFDINNAAKANRYVGIINQEIDRTLLLLKDFSDVSKLNIEKNIMEVNMLLEDVCDESKMIFKSNMKFKYNISDDEVYINGDYNRLKQVLINVIKNAKEAIGENGIVSLKTKTFKNKYIITIKDNGIGIDKETAKKIGTAFYTTKKNGTGLGVCFSKEIIEKHGGTMEYISKEKKGTTVKIILPINKTSTN